jgi:hypothetical protein
MPGPCLQVASLGINAVHRVLRLVGVEMIGHNRHDLMTADENWVSGVNVARSHNNLRQTQGERLMLPCRGPI